MALTSFQAIYSGLDTPESGATQTESHRVPVSAPYEILLSRIPRCSALATSVLNNPFASIELFRAEMSVTLNGVAATIIESQTPVTSGQVACQIIAGSAFEFSPKVIFHSSDAGKTAAFTYTGFMSNADSRYITTVREAVNRIEDLPPCAVISASTYDSGRFQRGTADTTGIYVTALRGSVSSGQAYLTFAGAALDLAAAGATQVAAFSDVDGYKTISVYLQDINGVLTLRTAESAESASRPTTPTITAADGWLCGAVIVQGDGTGDAGGIEPIAAADCVSLWDQSGGTVELSDTLLSLSDAAVRKYDPETATTLPHELEYYHPDYEAWFSFAEFPNGLKVMGGLLGHDGTDFYFTPNGAGYGEYVWLETQDHKHENEFTGMIMLSHESGTYGTGWKKCDGGTVLRSTFIGQWLASLNYPYGTGDGSTTATMPTMTAPTGFAYFMYGNFA